MPLTLEDDLIECARCGGAGLDRLIEAAWPEAYRIAFGILRDAGLAEDAAQEACAAMARSLSSLKSNGAFYAWSYRIIVNRALTVARRRPPTQRLEAIRDNGTQFDRSDALDLSNALGALPPVQRAAIFLHYYADLDSGEIARATGLPRSTVRFHLMLARRNLRKALGDVEMQSHSSSKGALTNVH